MSDWQVGDLAVCVDDSACHCCNDPMPIRAGSVHRVSEVDSSWGYTGLAFEGVENESLHHYGFNQKSFRKIRPDEHQACEEEFVTPPANPIREVRAASEWLLGLDLEYLKGLNAESLGDCADAHRRHSAEPEPVSRLRPSGECQHIARSK